MEFMHPFVCGRKRQHWIPISDSEACQAVQTNNDKCTATDPSDIPLQALAYVPEGHACVSPFHRSAWSNSSSLVACWQQPWNIHVSLAQIQCFLSKCTFFLAIAVARVSRPWQPPLFGIIRAHPNSPRWSFRCSGSWVAGNSGSEDLELQSAARYPSSLLVAMTMDTVLLQYESIH